MLIITCIYLVLVYLLFFKLQLLPWNKISQGLVVLIGVVILSGFLVGLQGLTPASVQGAITGRVIEIAPDVAGRVVSVRVEPDVMVEKGDKLFAIDPTLYEARVEELEARLGLSRLRLEQYLELAASDAGSVFQVEQAEAEVKQLEASLAGARFDLSNTVVRAPSIGVAPRVVLRPGMTVSPSRAVITFVDTSELAISAQFQQKALINVKAGDKAMVNFPALPGQVFEAKVILVPGAIGNAQLLASGQLQNVEQFNMTRIYPVMISLPEEFPDKLRKVGLAASVTIHTEGAGVVGIVAVVLQWVGTSLDAVL
ncbi:MAG: biotin/lipoyl-binding protein [Gammaproteobacteria bacterium]|jgi:multidrug resistance efflux pump|nr:biotin/lipoyl-binding protein [Gammaproteobacteria bacterium]